MLCSCASQSPAAPGYFLATHMCAPATLQLPAVEDVEYWHSAEKEGWMQSQGDYLSTWRKRWFVLKQGYLFRCVFGLSRVCMSLCACVCCVACVYMSA